MADRELQESSLAERHAHIPDVYSFTNNELLTRQRRRESNARSYPRRLPLALARARGVYVEDVEGRVYIDCLAAAGTLALGHNHPIIVEAIRDALRTQLPMQTLDLTTPIKDEFVEELFSLLPAELRQHGKIQFCGPTGTDAVEAALKLVRTATGRVPLLAFQGAYHGMSQGSLGLMGNWQPKHAISGNLGAVQFLPYPYDYRCPFGLGGAAGATAGLRYISSLLNDPESGVLPPAGLILEAVQGEGGVIPAPDDWLRALRQLCTDAKVPMILDEVQTGFGRTGRCFAFEHANVTPDVLVLSKAIGGGLPLAVIVYHERLDAWQPGAHAGTFRGNQLAMATGIAAMRFIRQEQLWQHAAAMGQRLLHELQQMGTTSTIVGDVRGRGLMLGIELVEPDARREAGAPPPGSRVLASAVQRACLERGLIVETGGRHGSVIRLLPPLIITANEVDRVASILGDAIERVEASAKHGGNS